MDRHEAEDRAIRHVNLAVLAGIENLERTADGFFLAVRRFVMTGIRLVEAAIAALEIRGAGDAVLVETLGCAADFIPAAGVETRRVNGLEGLWRFRRIRGKGNAGRQTESHHQGDGVHVIFSPAKDA